MRHYHVDRVVELEPGVRAVGIRGVSLSDDVFTDHFPGNPVLPGIYLLEGLAQTAGVLIACTTQMRKVAIMASIDRARFAAFVRPGDSVRLTIAVEAMDDSSARVRGSAQVGEREVAVARITFRLADSNEMIGAPFHQFWRACVATLAGGYVDPVPTKPAE
jgi:3-hydroxyacyl-[acyl-carrier-protein] dehydratase